MTQNNVSYPYTITKDSILVTVDGEPMQMLRQSADFELVKQAIREGRWENVVTLMTPAKAVEVLSHGRMRVVDGQVMVKEQDGSEFSVAPDLNEMILSYLKDDLPADPLVNFALKLRQNPSYKSVQQLFGFVQANKLTITEDGDFIGYKGVTADFKDCHTRTFDNSIGASPKMNRNEVEDDPNKTCSQGLHVAAYEYAHSFSSENVVFVSVNPRDVVSVPTDYNQQKMRVCEYKVLGVSTGEMKGKLYTEPKPASENEDWDCGCACDGCHKNEEDEYYCEDCGRDVSSDSDLCDSCEKCDSCCADLE